MFKRNLSIAGLALVSLALLSQPATSQLPPEWDPSRLQVTRADLEDLHARLIAVVESPAYSEPLRAQAQRTADGVQRRLTDGDFAVGDIVFVDIEGEDQLQDTMTVAPGPSLVFPAMTSVSLRGVLRSELEDHLRTEIGRYVRDPNVRAASMIRIQFTGDGGPTGFHQIPSDMPLADAIMNVGSLSQTAQLDNVRLERGDEVLYEGETVEDALAQGWSLDRLGLLAGDRVNIPSERPSQIWPQIFRWSVVIASSTLLGFRLTRF